MSDDDYTYHNCTATCPQDVSSVLHPMPKKCGKKCDCQTKSDGSHPGPHHCPEHGNWS
jgi:hypothetical protein